jgi:hypothetical protein
MSDTQLLAEVVGELYTTRIIRCGDLYNWVREYSPEEMCTHTTSAKIMHKHMSEDMMEPEELNCLAIAADEDKALIPAYLAAIGAIGEETFD